MCFFPPALPGQVCERWDPHWIVTTTVPEPNYGNLWKGLQDSYHLNLFVIEDSEIRGPVMELFVDDLEKARDTLVANGCQVLRWRGKGQDCYIEDPFGVIFNIWEE